MAPTFSFFFLCISLTLIPFSIANVESDALYAFKQSLSDPNNALESWDNSLVDPCTWFHITCDGDQSGSVIRVDLSNQNLTGHLVPDLANLHALQYLELYGNNIQGTIPPELGSLKSLVSLDLYKNNLSGEIPPSLGYLNNVIFIRINNNHLAGGLPESLGTLQKLRILDVSNNNLSGPISAIFQNIPITKIKVLCPNLVDYSVSLIKLYRVGTDMSIINL
ncbi:leucine-rich repeat protein 1-like [Lotus japonicus]|uniref:leucine-rich repeat protein 1-like n=1 Tax=Lotus japonicus TaxID=34305 RepID=UPI00258306F8|nr:leucine-rich repeat protein 1-like [Lotus japonicus]